MRALAAAAFSLTVHVAALFAVVVLEVLPTASPPQRHPPLAVTLRARAGAPVDAGPTSSPRRAGPSRGRSSPQLAHRVDGSAAPVRPAGTAPLALRLPEAASPPSAEPSASVPVTAAVGTAAGTDQGVAATGVGGDGARRGTTSFGPGGDAAGEADPLAALRRRLAELAPDCYPRAAQRLGLEGRTQMRVCARGGGPERVEMIRASGHAVLDEAAATCVVAAAAPYPELHGCVVLPVEFVAAAGAP